MGKTQKVMHVRWVGRRATFLLLLLLVLPALIVACGEMEDQPSFMRQESAEKTFPVNSVPVTGKQMRFTEQQAVALENPLDPAPNVVEAGQNLYVVYCRMCHGEDLRGTGAIAQYYPPSPPDLTGETVRARTDGQIFWAITNGFGRMPAFGKVLTDTQRWQLVAYVRTLR
jgi:mono/diheme cytochrome c family protein